MGILKSLVYKVNEKAFTFYSLGFVLLSALLDIEY